MSDIFREVDEDLNRDRMHKIWEAYGTWIIGAAVAVVIGVAGTQFWDYYQTGKQRQLSDDFIAANDLLNAGKNEEAVAAFEEIAGKTTSGYKTLSQFKEAATLVNAGQVQEAVDLYDDIAARGTGDDLLRDLAKLRAGWALADSASYDDLQARLSDLAASESAFAPSAQEVLAYSALRNGDVDAARLAYGNLVNSVNTTQGIRQRASAMLSVIGPARVAVEDATEEGAQEDATAEDTSVDAPAAVEENTAPTEDTTGQ